MKLPPFQALVDEHGDKIFRFLVAAVGRDAAEDCFQETFLSALRAYPDLERADNLKGWLFTIAYRKTIDHRRSRRPIHVDAESSVPEPSTVPDLWAAVGRLPDKQRAAIALRYVDDLPYRRIGQIVGCSEAAARQNVRAGLARLREEMDR